MWVNIVVSQEFVAGYTEQIPEVPKKVTEWSNVRFSQNSWKA
jgi:hypothetical protein